MNGKIMIASDIHGSAFWCEKLLKAYETESPEKLLLLGDILYHGPRNDLPDGYAPKKVFASLNPLKDNILCVRGNCDSEVDQMVLEFPVLADFALLSVSGKTLYATHGHLAGETNPPPLFSGDVLLNGHTHVPCRKKLTNGVFYVNCGSVALPKENTPHSYLVFEKGVFLWKNLETGEVFDRLEI
ncbi:MAG: phosphodiesterase [Clostridia bacterium]|nr:phosphodiesterase [Clostridia bacterium]